jgi:hypothetical protein
MATAAIPFNNPTGLWGAGNFNTGGMFSTSSGFTTPGTGSGGPGSMNFGNTMNPNAVFGPGTTGSSPQSASATGQPAATSAQPNTASGTGPTQSGQFVQPFQDVGGMDVSGTNNPLGMTEGQQYWELDYLQKAFGPMGPMIYQYLNSEGGYNSQLTQQTVDAQTNAMQKQTQVGANAITSSLASQGVTGASSGMGDALTAYENQATQQQNAITAQEYYNMWNASQDREAAMMQYAATAVGTEQANKVSGLDWLTGGATLFQAIAGTKGGSGSSGGSMSPEEMMMLMGAAA